MLEVLAEISPTGRGLVNCRICNDLTDARECAWVDDTVPVCACCVGEIVLQAPRVLRPGWLAAEKPVNGLGENGFAAPDSPALKGPAWLEPRERG